MKNIEPKKPCPGCCYFDGIIMEGVGRDSKFTLCPLWQESGHPSEEELKAKFDKIRRRLNPSK